MSLTLTLRNPEAAPGTNPTFTLDGDSALIGRSPRCDWSLPDPSNTISSRHAEIRRGDKGYVLKDISTNGTFLNGAAERMNGEHMIADGDVLRIGRYELVASLQAPGDRTVIQPAHDRTMIAPAPAPEPPLTPRPAPAPAPAPPPPPPAPVAEEPEEKVPENVTVMWNSLADMNKVDWSRGGLGVKTEAPAPTHPEGETAADLVDSLLTTTGLTEQNVPKSPELVDKAGALLKRLVAGLVVLVEARARAKSQMGAEMTGLELEGNNPIKFARSPEQALAQLLNPTESGFMESDRAVEDAYLDLQSHQMATLRAIPGALRATLDRFSPGSVRRRADSLGFLAKFIPAFRDAALWRGYEREYVKVKNESDEAFMQVFAKGFRKAYERQLREGFNDDKPEGL